MPATIVLGAQKGHQVYEQVFDEAELFEERLCEDLRLEAFAALARSLGAPFQFPTFAVEDGAVALPPLSGWARPMRHVLQRRGDLARKGRQGLALSGHHGRVAVRVSRERDVRFLEQDCFLVL
jgi:hypothetical protein